MNNRRFINIVKVSMTAFVLVFSACVIILNLSHTAFASPSNADIILKKTLLNGIQTCYNDTYMKSSIIPADFVSPSSLFTSGFGTKGDSDGTIRVPNNFGNSLNDADISCQQLFTGYSGAGGRISGLFSLFGKSSSISSEAQKITLLKNLGYYVNQTESSVDTGCLSVSYQTVRDSQYTNPISTNQICIKLTDGKVDVGYSAEGLTYTNDFTDPVYIYYDPVNYKLSLMSTESLYELNYVSLSPYRTPTWSEFETTIKNQFVGDYNWDGEYGQGGYHYRVQSVPASTTGGETFSEAIRSSNAAQDALHFFSGEPNATFTTYSFVTEDKYALYTAYLNQELRNNSSVIMGSGSECASTLDVAKSATGYAVRNGAQWCALHGVESGGSYNIIENRLNNKLVAGTFKDVVNELMSLNYDRLEEAGVDIGELEGGAINGGADTDDPGSEGPGEDGDAGLVDGCFNNSGALGWIICPVLRMAGAATTGIYQSIADNYLTVKSETMTSEALRGVWSDFQGYANILFAILLIIVILSQVTGVGLSNYGIKKVLPRLIITIILVNLSFILCSVAVDLSNILGTRLNDFFMNWKIGGYIAKDLNVGTMIGNTIESLFSVGVGTTFTVVGIKVAIATGAWEGIILSLLLTVLVAFISIIFFYIILGVRQAAIVILIAVAPVAIVCYALPNTQKVFDRWLKIFSSLLLVFPICGLLMGGSNFASRLLLGANGEVGFMYFLVAMLLSVIPLFFVPAVLKSSMSAMGNLGTKISNMGSRFGNWSNRTVRNTRAYQDRMQEAQRNSNMKRDKNIMDKYSSSSKRISELEAKEKAGTLTSRERSQLARARYRRARAVSRYEKGVLEDKQSEILASREDLTPGTKRYDSMVASLSEAQLNKDSSEWENLYTHGGVENFSGTRDASGNITKVTAGNLNALASEHRALLERVTEHPEDAVAMAKLRAVQNIMGKKGDKFHEKMRENYASIMDASHTSDLDSEGYRQAATHLQDNFASQIKAGDRGFDKMLAEIQGGAIAAASRNSSRFDTLGSMGYTAESLNNLNDGTLDRLSAAVKSGSLSGPALDHIVKIANDAIHNPKIALKGDVEQKLHDILSSAYTRTATVAGSSRMVGSSLIGNASSEAIDSIVKKVQDAGDWSSMSTQQQTEYGNLVRNIQDSLQHDTHSRENVRQLQGALQTAKNKGFLPDASGTSTVSVVEPTTFKIERGAPQAERHADVPADWRVAAHAPGGYMVKDSTGVLRNLNAQELEQLKEIQAFNRQIDMRNSSRGFNAGGSGSSS